MEDFFFIVDDNPQMSFKLNNIVKTNLARTIVIEKFEDLFGKLLDLQPRLVLISKEVLNEKNFRLIRKLKNIPRYLPIIVVYSEENILEKSQVSLMKVGVDGFIQSLENPHWIVLYLKSLFGIQQSSTFEAEGNQKYRMLFETMFSAYALHEIIVDEENNPIDYRFLEVNPAFERITGMKANQVVGHTIYELFPNTDIKTVQTYGEVALYGEKLQFEQFSNEHKKYFEVVAFSPQKGQFSTVFIDITQYKEALRLVQDSEKELKELNATKDKFFSIVAHDLKNPFQGILGFVELLHNDLDEFDKEELKMVIAQIKEATENAYNLVINLLEWSRLQLNRIVLKPATINLYELASVEMTVLNAQAKSKQIKLKIDLPEDLQAYADENMIRMVLRNLISNAIKFTYQGGEILIRSNLLPKFVDIEIKDNGIGISQENIQKLFKVNQQVVNQGTDKEKGTGLGLILCKEFIEKNNGKIWVESKLGTGSSFHILLPTDELKNGA